LTHKIQHGGAREGAGRPKSDTKPDKKESVTIRLTPDQREKLQVLGGGKWVRQMINEVSA